MADLVSVALCNQPLEIPVNCEHKSVDDDSQSSAVQEINELLDDDYDHNTQYDPLKVAGISVESLEQDADGSENIGSAKEKRKVQFPIDSDIVKGYLDPPDPWRDVPDWQTEDLLRAYKQGCEKHGVKPLNKVLQQLQCIENVGERYEILSLKGEHLDLRHCESLEEILKYVRFRCIDLEATHLDDEMAVALFEMVEYYESACKLNISCNKGISARGWQSCARLIRKTPCLTFIDAHNCDLNESMVPILGRSLRMGCFLQRLHLQNCNLAGRGLLILVAALKVNDVLTELFLGDNKLLPTDGIQIGNLLKYNHKLELLDLRNNHLQDVGVGNICDGLVEQTLHSGLLTLVLWNNQITFQGIAAINRALTKANHLETLNLGHNPVTNEGIHILKDGLLKSKGLLKLGLAGTKISCEGAVALAEVIADNTRLVRLDLQENDIKTAGLMALSLALKVNENITRLDVDRDTKKETGVKDYLEQQKRLKNDINKLVDRNKDVKNKREENQLKEIISKENVKNLEETEQDLVSLETNDEYIPTSDTVQRPKLLLIPHSSQVCPEQELDSPHGGEFVFEPTSPVDTLQLIPPNGADLLSPQYCSNPKATTRKIFSVAKVAVTLSPSTLSGIDANSGYAFSDTNLNISVINSPTQICPNVEIGKPFSGVVIPHLCSSLPTVHFPGLITSLPLNMHLDSTANMNSPNSVQKDIEDEILMSFLNVDDLTDEHFVTIKDNFATCERNIQSDDTIKDVNQLTQNINENIGNIQNEHNADVAFDFSVNGNLTQTPEDDITTLKSVVNKSCISNSFISYAGEVISNDSVPIQISDIKENTDVKTSENYALIN